MALHHSSSDSESSDGEDAPEVITLAQSKKDIQKLDAELKKAEIAARKSKKSQNREMDRKLKERADMNRGGKQMKGDEVGGMEARMYRAMQEAQEEMDEEGESGSVGDSEKDDGDKEEEQEDDSSLKDDQGSKEEGVEEEAEVLPPNPLTKKTLNANHLPDKLFTAAFASKASTSKRKAPDDEEDNPPKQTSKKPKRPHTRRDLIVGSRAIRMLPTPGQPITPSVAPSSKINKFLNRSLALKGGRQQSKTWERRTANIGVFRRDGPASNFVRNR